MKSTRMLTISVVAFGLMVCLAEVSEAEPMGTAWTYQGRLMRKNKAAKGFYDFEFKLFDGPADGNQTGGTVEANDVDVINGYFTLELDFGSPVLNGDARWLEIGVRPGNSDDPNDFVTLSRRQEVTPTPYALYAMAAGHIPGGIMGTGGANYVSKFMGPNTVGDSVIYESAGSIGIGTTSPDEKLHVTGNTKVEGDLVVTGAYGGTIGPNNGAPFPRPAYDSGWVNAPTEYTTLFHNIGGNVDNYVVDVSLNYAEVGIWGQGLYTELTSDSIKVGTSEDWQVRVRIWVYN